MEISAFANSSCGNSHFCSSSEMGITRIRTAVPAVPVSGSSKLTLLQKAKDCSPFIGLVYAREMLIDSPISLIQSVFSRRSKRL